MKTKLTYLIIGTIIYFTILVGCKKEISVTENAPDKNSTEQKKKDDVLYGKLKLAGFLDSQIEDIGDAYLVEGDLLFNKFKTDLEFFDEYYGLKKGKSDKSNKTKQWHTDNIISHDNAERIKFVLTPGADVFSAIYQAGRNWSEIPSVNIATYVYNGHVITDNTNKIEFIRTSVQGGGAIAEFPVNGTAGFRIRIDPSVSNLSYSKQVWLITHEIGHCLGFRHTDYYFTESPGTVGANHIPNTPVGNDPVSVMNSSIYHNGVVQNWNGFSNYDIIAAQYLYPHTDYDKWITNPLIKTPFHQVQLSDYYDNINFQWNSNLINSNSLNIELYQYGSLVRTLATNLQNNGSFSFPIATYLNFSGGNRYSGEVQIKLVDANNPSRYDFTPLFYVYLD